ncbi:hypothetical protein JTB14_020952 [Gonioctena quinquepunctata]|nr:hypothetical protein JTB14_020952 [Gonioctena quinquepunctata]
MRSPSSSTSSAPEKVNLTVQTISASVADALEFLMVDVCDPNFAGAKATIEFIRIVDRAFDLLNSRNPFGKGYKTPMKPETEKYGDSYLRRQLCI